MRRQRITEELLYTGIYAKVMSKLGGWGALFKGEALGRPL